jgi:hypothetical protein
MYWHVKDYSRRLPDLPLNEVDSRAVTWLRDIMPVLTLGPASLLSRPPVLLRGPVHMVTLHEIGRLSLGRIILDGIRQSYRK